MPTVRIFFEKCGESAYISLLDLQRVFHRMLKMSSLPVYYTQGFNPHIYLSFTCPLSLGQESLCESCEVKTEQETIDPQAWIDALQPLFERGDIIFNELERDSQGMRVLVEQLLCFEKGSKIHDDAPDALEGAIWKLSNSVRKTNNRYAVGRRASRRW